MELLYIIPEEFRPGDIIGNDDASLLSFRILGIITAHDNDNRNTFRSVDGSWMGNNNGSNKLYNLVSKKHLVFRTGYRDFDVIITDYNEIKLNDLIITFTPPTWFLEATVLDIKTAEQFDTRSFIEVEKVNGTLVKLKAVDERVFVLRGKD